MSPRPPSSPAPPAEVLLGAHTWRVVYDADGLLADAGRSGHCSPSRLVIGLEADLPHTVTADALLHELVHAMLASCPLDTDDDAREELEERVASALGPQLLELVRRNPDLVDWLLA